MCSVSEIRNCQYLIYNIFACISEEESEEPLTPDQLKMYSERLADLEKVLNYHYLPSDEGEMTSNLAMLNLSHVNVRKICHESRIKQLITDIKYWLKINSTFNI